MLNFQTKFQAPQPEPYTLNWSVHWASTLRNKINLMFSTGARHKRRVGLGAIGRGTDRFEGQEAAAQHGACDSCTCAIQKSVRGFSGV